MATTDGFDQNSARAELTRAQEVAADLDDQLKAAIARSAEARNPGPLVDELLDRVVDAVHPDGLVVFSVDENSIVEVHRLRSLTDVAPRLDFSWAAPMFEVGGGDRSSIGPTIDGRTPIVIAMDAGQGRLGCLLVTGVFDDPEAVQARIIGILREARDVLVMVWSAARGAADEAMARVRTELSQELHDSLSQSLWSLSMLSETAHQLIDPSDPAHDIVRRITETSLRTQAQMRQLLGDLRSEGPPASVADALEQLAEDFHRSSGVEISVTATSAEVRPAVAEVVARVAEEALNNVERHAAASSVRVLFDADPTPVLIVEDDGVGCAGGGGPGHLGIQIMKERAAEIGLDVELTSAGGSGTALIMAENVEREAAIIERRRPSPPGSSRGPISWSFLAALLLVVGLVAVGASLAQNERAAEAQASVDQAQIMDARLDIGRAIMDEVTIDLVAAFGFVGDAEADAATDRRVATLDEASAAVAEFVDEPDPVGVLARQTRELSSGVEIDGVSDMFVGYDVGYALFESMPVSIDEARPMAPALALGSLEQLALLSLHEGLMARWASNPDALVVTDAAAELFGSVAPGIERAGGLFGADSEQPLRGSLLPTAVVEADDPEGLAELNRIVVEQDLWVDDQWVRNWTPDGPPAPTSAEDHIRRALAARDDMRSVVDGRFDALIEMYRSESASAQQIARALAVVALLAAIGLAWTLLRLRRALLQRGRLAAVDRSLDPLTGVANRRALDDRVRPLLQNPTMVHHVLVTLDMDRFKAVNDVHGHPFGDRVLTFVGRGLSCLAEEFAGEASTADGVAVRLGGDEFLLSLHSAGPIDVDVVRRSLDRLRSSALSAPDGSMARAEFSYGVVHADGSPGLASLMTASDLAAYEDKRRQNA